jgi:hypothetical protein
MVDHALTWYSPGWAEEKHNKPVNKAGTDKEGMKILK